MWYIVLKHKILTRPLEESYDKMVGERSKYVYCQDGSMVVTVWQNTNPVLMLSTNWYPTDTESKQKKKRWQLNYVLWNL